MSQIGSITNKVLSNHKQIIESTSNTLGHDKSTGNFGTKLERALDSVADAQKIAADTTRNFELGIENDLTKVMINQQISHLDAVLFTHEHKDHVAGLDDVRPFNFIQKKLRE